MNKLLLTTLTAALGAAAALAMPTKADLEKTQPLVKELMAPSLSAFRSARRDAKAAAAARVADTSSSFAKDAETDAAKFLLLKGAIPYYVRAEEYDKAADAVEALQREITDIPTSVIAEIIGKAADLTSEAEAPRLYALYRTAKLQARAADDVKTLAAKLKAAKLKKVQSDALQRRYAEALALSGDWKAAYAAFAKVQDAKLQGICAAVATAKGGHAAAGEFWWGYKPTTEGSEDFFRAHAAAFYSLALDTEEMTVLRRKLLRQRIADVPEVRINDAFPPLGYAVKDKGDIAYDLRIMDIITDGGTSWEYTDKAPDGGLEAFSKVDYPAANLRWGKSPLSAENGWECGTKEYWVRREFTCPVPSSRLTGGRLLVQTGKGQRVEVWLNGKKIYEVRGDWYYCAHQLDVRGIRQGRNVLAAHVFSHPQQTTGRLDLRLCLAGKGLYGYAKAYVGQEKPVVSVDVKSLPEETVAVKDALHGGAEWRYSTTQPTDDWFAPAFDDAAWLTGKGGFAGGTLAHKNPLFPQQKCNSKWNTTNIWMRTTFDYAGGAPSDIAAAVLSFSKGDVHRGAKNKTERIIVYLNGKKIHEDVCLSKSAWSDHIDAIDLTEKIRPALAKGRNVLAVYACVPPVRLRFWVRYIDVGLYLK